MEFLPICKWAIGMSMEHIRGTYGTYSLVGVSFGAVPSIHTKSIVPQGHYHTITLSLQMNIPTNQNTILTTVCSEQLQTLAFHLKFFFCPMNNVKVTRHGLHQSVQIFIDGIAEKQQYTGR